MKLFGIILSLVAVTADLLQETNVEDKKFWRKLGSATLDEVLNRKQESGVAKNVIVFIGDGMGVSTVTAARIYHGQLYTGKGESNVLSFEKFPAVGLSKTYDVSHQVPDSAATATAIFSGVKIHHAMLGLDAMASYNSCNVEINKEAKVPGAMTWAQLKGKDTGIVTTARVTHATPAATYAYINNRDWECDSQIPKEHASCVKDIARQLVEDEPGNKFKVILGGGRNQLGVEESNRESFCTRDDKRNLAKFWEENKTNAKYVSTAEELAKVDFNKTDYLLGLFAADHLKFLGEKDPTRPSLKQMTEAAIKILGKNSNGFVLLVEAARIDMAHHNNQAKLALLETVEMHEAIAAAADMTDPRETLIVVTADHSHSVTMNGYPKRGNNILGLAQNESNSFFETITYANGPGYEYHHPKTVQDNCKGTCSELEKQSANSVKDIRKDNARDVDVYYRQFAAFYLTDDTHGGEDVAVYASGPKSHLLVGVYEQNYIANVISYASCIGPEAHRCKDRRNSSQSSSSFFFSYLLVLPLLSIFGKFL